MRVGYSQADQYLQQLSTTICSSANYHNPANVHRPVVIVSVCRTHTPFDMEVGVAGLAASILLASCTVTAAQYLALMDARQELAGAAAVRGEGLRYREEFRENATSVVLSQIA